MINPRWLARCQPSTIGPQAQLWETSYASHGLYLSSSPPWVWPRPSENPQGTCTKSPSLQSTHATKDPCVQLGSNFQWLPRCRPKTSKVLKTLSFRCLFGISCHHAPLEMKISASKISCFCMLLYALNICKFKTRW